MKIISLDQNVISNLVKNQSEPFWGELRKRLIAGVEQRKLLCPIPKETILETIPCSRENRIEIRDLAEKLSAGFSFKRFGSIEAEETMALIRPGPKPSAYERIRWHSVEDNDLARAHALEFQHGKQAMLERMKAFVEPLGHAKFELKEVHTGIITSRAGDFSRQLDRLKNGLPLDPRDHLSLALCRGLLKRGITKVEMQILQEMVLQRRWDAIPLLTYHAALSSVLEYDMFRGRKYQVNDEFDKLRISVGLHCSALVITDRAIANIVRRVEKEFKIELEVISLTEYDEIKIALERAMSG